MSLLTLEEIYKLADLCLRRNGADAENAFPLATTIMKAERDGSLSHGLFRLPAYVAALRSGKMKGNARPVAKKITSSVIKIDGDNACAPFAHQIGIPILIEAAKETGVALAAFTRMHHMAALWPEVEMIAEHNLVGMTCTTYMSAVAPAGARQPFFGTNPIAFAWPRPQSTPVVFDMATASMAKGEIQVAARDGHAVLPETGLNSEGVATTNPAEILEGGVILPFGGYKGSAISMMVELLAAGLVGDSFSYEATETDNGDGGPPQGGQFLLALSPEIVSNKDDWQAHSDNFFNRLMALEGARLPGERRHKNRLSTAPREIKTELLDKINALL